MKQALRGIVWQMVSQLDENSRMIETQKMEINSLREQLRKYVDLNFRIVNL